MSLHSSQLGGRPPPMQGFPPRGGAMSPPPTVAARPPLVHSSGMGGSQRPGGQPQLPGGHQQGYSGAGRPPMQPPATGHQYPGYPPAPGAAGGAYPGHPGGPPGGGGGYDQNSYYANQQGMCGTCCQPQMPGQAVEEYLCGPPAPDQAEDAAFFNPCATSCDCGTLATIFFALMSLVGFAIVLATKSPDNLFDVYSVKNTAELQDAFISDVPYLLWLRANSDNRTDMIINDLYTNNQTTTTPTTTSTDTTTSTTSTTCTGPPAPPATTSTSSTNTLTTIYNFSTTTTTTTTTPTTTTTTTTTAPNTTATADPFKPSWRNYPADPVWLQECVTMSGLTGTWGSVCMEQALNSANIYFQLSRWTVFRDTLYFIAMLGSIGTLILIIVIHRIKNPPPQFGTGAPTEMPVDVPIAFSGTPFYYVFRSVWFCSGLIVFLWTVTVLYEYLNVMSQYQKFSTGDLNNFFKKYDAKFIPSVIIVTIFLAWPVANMALELVFFIVFIIPYYFYRNMSKQGIEFVRYPIETPLDSIPGWVRLDAFFTEFRQAKRLGFSLPMWHTVTGTYDEYLDCMGPPNNMMPPPGYPGYPPQPGYPAAARNVEDFGNHSAAEMSQATVVPEGESPNHHRRSRRSKSERSMEKSESRSHERHSKSRDKKERRRPSSASAIRGDESNLSAAGLNDTSLSNTNGLDNFDGTRREKKKKDKAEKKPKEKKEKSKTSKKDRDHDDDDG